jgi:nicotinamidase-related amidase
VYEEWERTDDMVTSSEVSERQNEMTSHQTIQKRALLIIDVQNEYFTGNLRIEYPDVDQSLAKICNAMDAARASGIPVVIVQHVGPETSPIAGRGSIGAELHPSIAERHRDVLIEKSKTSALNGTSLGAWLRVREIDTLTLVGYMTHNCVTATALQAAQEGWMVEVLHDACGSVSYTNAVGSASAEEIHRAYTVVLHTGFAAVATTAQWLGAIKSGEALVADNIFHSNQRALKGIS